MDFKSALLQSLTTAKELSGNRSQIRAILEKFSNDILEASDSKVAIVFRAETYSGEIDLKNIFSEIVNLNKFENESQNSIYICAKSLTEGHGTALAKLTWHSISGYPCNIEFDGYRYSADNTESLESTLKEMLSSPFVIQKIYNFMVSD